jgi:hypothetical protein
MAQRPARGVESQGWRVYRSAPGANKTTEHDHRIASNCKEGLSHRRCAARTTAPQQIPAFAAYSRNRVWKTHEDDRPALGGANRSLDKVEADGDARAHIDSSHSGNDQAGGTQRDYAAPAHSGSGEYSGFGSACPSNS